MKMTLAHLPIYYQGMRDSFDEQTVRKMAGKLTAFV
jgi:hypothetical protein